MLPSFTGLLRRPGYLKKLGAAILIVSILAGCANPQLGSASGQDTPTTSRAIQPIGTPNGKKVLFDNAHAQTAGAADWVIDGAFSDFGNALAARGYLVDELRLNRALTLADLTGWDAFVIPEANVPFKTSEQQALVDYVNQGGAIFFIADHYNADRNLNRWDSGEVFNGYRRGAFGNPTLGMNAGEAASSAMQGVTSTDWLASQFGVRFRYNAIGNVNATDIVAPAQAFNITANVGSVAMHAGSTLAILDPTKAKGIVYLPATTAAWANAVDQGVYNGGGRAEGPYAAVGKLGLGKVAFIGDSSPVEDSSPKYKREDTGGTKTTYAGWQEVDDDTLLTQIVDWLATPESYTSLSQVSGLVLDTPTTLLAMETPASSTEPQSEPWTTPTAGYLWYDQSTFATGAYRYTASSGIAVAVSPSSVSLAPSTTQQFTATVTGTTNTGVVWSATGGTITSTGLYTAPAVAGTFVVTAQSSADSAAVGTASVSVQTSGGGSGLTETFDTGSKTAYATGSVTLGSGSWTLSDALLGSDANDHRTGAQAARVRNTGTVTMNFDLTGGAGTVTLNHAVYGTDGSSTWGLWYSTNAGSSWTQVGSNVTTSAATLTAASFTVNVGGTVRLQIRKATGGTNRINLDDLVVGTYQAPPSLTETFDTGSKTAYTTGSVTLASGSWTLNDALLGSDANDHRTGAQALRIRNTGTVTMDFNLTGGAGTVTLNHAVYGTNGSSTWGLWYSTNSGSTWTQAGTNVTTSSATLSAASFTVNASGAIRLQIRKATGGANRINLDDLTVSSF